VDRSCWRACSKTEEEGQKRRNRENDERIEREEREMEEVEGKRPVRWFT
jgi:hypothetical protein